ncbi:sensor histidine kinase [Paeniglutamicibacter kerguelensis]|uniref:histidine kinase n=1 Tax=Paeniglutamicibacter kerguelensis TaxID=254788 RepID=A0ABS4XJA4_9MICC|nr:HAMP domain-containing sensor histidine kinase [Paeniglutamicibacter kerguelensis]MBP2388510.1 two-component system OmpR family sensor kinase [Paeniglutamicibacter kerguelensis]
MSNHARPRITQPEAPEKDSGTGPEDDLSASDSPPPAGSPAAPNDPPFPSAPEGTPEDLPRADPSAEHSFSRRYGHFTLQRRLLLALIGSLAMICAVIGLLINAGMRQTLSSQLNEQLAFAADRAEAYSRSQGHPTNPAPLFAPGQASGTLNAKIVSGYLFAAGVLDEKTGERKDIVDTDTLPLSQLVVGAPPVVRHLSIGDYLLSAQPDPANGGILITGLPLEPNERTIASLTWLTVIISTAGLAATGLAGSIIIRRSLAPLKRVSSVASSVANAELDAGTVALEVRVAPEDSVPGTESGDVGNALNALLDNVATAFAAREQSEAQMRQFVADASHELRTPLSAIRGYTELLSATEHFSDDGQRSLDRVLEQSTRMSSLVENLLLLARLDEKHQLKKAPVNLGQLVSEITEDFRITTPDHHWVTRVPETPVVVSADASSLRRVITNLLANARKHTSAGNTVMVRLDTDSAAQEAVLQVEDTGEGIDEAFLPHVFKRFTRADSARSGADGTTGLGLPIAQAIAEAHGGTISVVSKPGQTVFTVRLPLPDDVPPKPDHPTKVAKPPTQPRA